MVCNSFGFFCEEMIRDLLPEIGIPHKFQRCGGKDWFWWASTFEDKVLGVDCWVTLNLVEIAVDFTIISAGELVQVKTEKALGRGVVPVFLDRTMLLRAEDGSERDLRAFDMEVRAQIPLKLAKLNGNRMTKTLADQRKLALGHTHQVPIIQGTFVRGAVPVSA